jgi:hypothetical protein
MGTQGALCKGYATFPRILPAQVRLDHFDPTSRAVGGSNLMRHATVPLAARFSVAISSPAANLQ